MEERKNIFCKENVLYVLLLNFGLLLLAAGIHFFKAPNHFAMGGTSGIAILAASLVPQLNVGSCLLVLNAALIVLGFFFLGVKRMGVTIYSSLVLSLFVSLLEWLWPMAAPFTADTMLELFYAVLLPAAGSALIFNIGASSGGTEIVAMILAEKTSLAIGKALLVTDFLIALSAGWLYGVRIGMYCVLGLLAKAFVVDGIIDGINARKEVTVVSSKPDAILQFIMLNLNRGATIYTGHGAFTGKEEQIITTVLSRRQAVALRNFIRRTDQHAFITIVNSSETIGKGFRDI
jgi:uncharacterized membrane-anchored protein YitT (DUF2179 family)